MEISEEDFDDYLEHYGTPRHSGRYPWGSGGEDTDTRNASFNDHVNDLKRQGMSETDIAKGFGIKSVNSLRAKMSIEKNAQISSEIALCQRLSDKGYSNNAISKRTGIPEATVRSRLAPGAQRKADILLATSDMLKKQVDEHTYVDVGRGVEQHLNLSDTKLNSSLAVLEEQGYKVYTVREEQPGTGLKTNIKVLTPPGTSYGDVVRNRSMITIPFSHTEDGGESYIGIKQPLAIHPDRVGITYAEQGGSNADGVMFVRPGVKDVELGGAKYAQVRVQVGDDHYLKGMAMYKDDLPEGVDIQFNTNKSDTGNKLDALKKLDKENPDNPFGATLKRQISEKINGQDVVTSSMNIVNEEGDWGKWSKSIAAQVLSKQNPTLAKTQLAMTYESRLSEFNSINSMTNPTVKKKLLGSFADQTDAAAVHLKAASLPRMGWHVILPMTSLPENQIYAPNFRNGESVVLIRYPHGGTFEIPELTVNNNHGPAKQSLGPKLRDAVVVHPKVAERLSGADFDGDTVLVIPNDQKKIKTSPALAELKDFDPKTSYPKYDGMKVMNSQQKAMEMGNISNLITDMTIQGAPHSDIASAIKHSMVVIDAEKHELNYKQSYVDNGIANLKEKYQGGKRKGASTLISRASGEKRVPRREPTRMSKGGPIDPVTGEKRFTPTGEINFRTGKLKDLVSKQLAETNDAMTLSSGTRIENIYADHSNKLKHLANQARLAYLRTPNLVYSSSAKKVYTEEVASLNSKLATAKRNAPLERRAIVLSNAMIRAKKDANPNMDKATLKKIKGQALTTARVRTGAKKQQIKITPKEWEAIQAGAISNSKLTEILDNADLDVVKQLAQPRTATLMTSAKTTRAKQMLDSGYTRSQVADQLGVSLSTLDNAVNPQSEGG